MSMKRLSVVSRQTAASRLEPDTTAGKATIDIVERMGHVAGAARSWMADPLDESNEHAGGKVAELLLAHGVSHVFCLSGGHISPMLVGAEKAGIKIVDVRHEVNAVFAADAMARCTGIPGVAMVTAGPGITNSVTAIKNAQMAQSPVVLLGGAAPLSFQGRGALQDIDQRVLLEPIVKKCWSVTAVRDIVPSIREAFCEAASGVPGPVFVELPLDILFPYLFIAAEAGLYTRIKKSELTAEQTPRVVVPLEHGAKTVEEYLGTVQPPENVFLRPSRKPTVADQAVQAIMRYRFAGARLKQEVTPFPVFVPKCPDGDVTTAARMLAEAARPVFVLGSQSTLQASKVNELAEAIKRLGAPAFLGGMARGLLGRDCPNFIRQNRGQALARSDLIIVVGGVVDFRMGYGKALGKPGQTKIIAVSRDQDHLDLNRGTYAELAGGGWRATLASIGDPCDFVLRLVEASQCDGRYRSWAAELKAAEAQVEGKNRAQGDDPAYGRLSLKGQRLINPLGLLQQLEEQLPDNAILVADGGDFVATASYILRPRGPLSWLDPGSFGTLGVGGGFALGAKLARPDAEVWLLWGDGAAGYSIAEVDALNRHGAPVIALIGNDACWGQIERDQTVWFGSSVSCNIEYLKYETVAEGYGGLGCCIGAPDKDEIAQTIARARRTLKETGKPVLINALIGSTNFREGSISA